MIDPLYKKHAWGILPFAHPTNRGLRIALVIETDNAVDPRKYMDSPYGSCRIYLRNIYDKPRQDMIHLSWASTIVTVFGLQVKLRSLRFVKRPALSKRSFYIVYMRLISLWKDVTNSCFAKIVLFSEIDTFCMKKNESKVITLPHSKSEATPSLLRCSSKPNSQRHRAHVDR